MPVGRVPELPVSILCRAPQPRSLWGAVARSSAATVPDSRLVGGVGLELGVARRRLRSRWELRVSERAWVQVGPGACSVKLDGLPAGPRSESLESSLFGRALRILSCASLSSERTLQSLH